VAEKVEVLTRSYRPGSSGFKWTCEVDIHYTVEEAEVPEAGTRAVLHLSDSSLVLLDDRRLTQAIKKYADFLSVPIYLKGNQVNSCTLPWETADGETDYDYVHKRYDLYPLTTIPFRRSKPLLLDGLLFVPMIPFDLTRDFGEVDIYISRMFVKANDKELLPGWARFVKGIINTPDLTPTGSRDEMVRDENHATIRAMLGEIILEHLAYLGEHNLQKLDLVVGSYNNTIKARSLEDNDFFDLICDLVRVDTSAGSVSMKEYLSRSGGTIYYFSERSMATQGKLFFAQKGLPVIDAGWGMEEEFLEKYAQRKNVKLEHLEAGSEIIFKVPETVDEKWRDLERQFALQVGKEAKAVAFEPNTVPAVLVAKPIEHDNKMFGQVQAFGEQLGFSSGQVREMFKHLSREKSVRATGGDTILHLNTTNPLMQQLRDMSPNETFRLALTAIYNNAMMFARHYVSPEDAEIIFTKNNEAFSAMIGNSRALGEVQTAYDRMKDELNAFKRKMPQLSEYRSCFFAFDYKIEENYELMEQIQQYFLERGLGIQVLAPAKEMDDLNIPKDLYRQLQTVHFGLTEITSNNLNVLYEAGFLQGLGKPVILLKEKGSPGEVPFDIFGDYRIEYELTRRAGQVKFVWLQEELDKATKTVFKMLPELERVPKWSG